MHPSASEGRRARRRPATIASALPAVLAVALAAGSAPAHGKGGQENGAQQNGAQEAEEPVAARIDDQVITLADYGRYLVERYGREPLTRLIDRHLVRREAARRGISVEDAAVEAAVESAWQSFLERARGDEAALVADVERSGFRVEEYRARLREEARDELLQQALCKADREVTDEDVRARYVREYGEDGNRVEVRHLLLTPARLRADLLAKGASQAELSQDRIDQRLRELAEVALERLTKGEDFAAVATSMSHDIAAPVTGGEIANYNYRPYGEPFANAVRAAEVGVPVGPVRSSAGYHVIEVTARTHTAFEDIADSLRETLTTEPAGYEEVEALLRRLRAASEIETY